MVNKASELSDTILEGFQDVVAYRTNLYSGDLRADMKLREQRVEALRSALIEGE